ncbi:hypothetical protein BDZ91DRAFT_734448 [Kalaharituber pfeilii]|nr:hypothetical protein BDZ91DRAFT_734448 [Kalaharituber pfeilii]
MDRIPSLGGRVLEATTEVIIHQQQRHERMLSQFTTKRLEEHKEDEPPDPEWENARSVVMRSGVLRNGGKLSRREGHGPP